MSSKIGRWIGFFLVISAVAAALLYTVKDSYIKGEPNVVEGYQPWSEPVVEAFAQLPVQDGGRIKPFSTWAGFQLLSINGKRTVRIEVDGEPKKLNAVEWALDCFFRPELATKMECFQVENDQILDMIGMKHEAKKRRDRYSLEDIEPYLEKLDALRYELDQKRVKLNERGMDEKLDLVEQQLMDFAGKIEKFRELQSHFDPVRSRLINEGPANMDESTKRFSSWVANWAAYRQLLLRQYQENPDMKESIETLIANIQRRGDRSIFSKIAMFPPMAKDQASWPARGMWLKKYLESTEIQVDAEQIAYLVALEKIALAYHDGGEEALLQAVTDFSGEVQTRMDQRGEGGSIALEQAYYRCDYFYNTLTVFILAFIIVALSWLSPGSRFSKIALRIAWVLFILGTLAIIAGITHRSIIMERPPVGNLYDTIPFICAISLIVLGFIEYLTKRGVGIGLGLFIAIVGLFLSIWYEEGKGVDTMDPLVAVLRSNFWLSTHVITVTMGYAGGLLTAGLAQIYIFARLFKIDEGDKSFRRMMTRIVYGGVCFTLFFSLVGTILGGVWANDSWGRFWGWDPKENGALIIVLWCLAILHARLGGYLKEWGIHICATIGACLVAFSWWHVNFLSIGLHNYGFTGGAGLKAIWAFYSLELLVIAVALVAAIYEWLEKDTPKTPVAKEAEDKTISTT